MKDAQILYKVVQRGCADLWSLADFCFWVPSCSPHRRLFHKAITSTHFDITLKYLRLRVFGREAVTSYQRPKETVTVWFMAVQIGRVIAFAFLLKRAGCRGGLMQ